jgi:hypothetical protein
MFKRVICSWFLPSGAPRDPLPQTPHSYRSDTHTSLPSSLSLSLSVKREREKVNYDLLIKGRAVGRDAPPAGWSWTIYSFTLRNTRRCIRLFTI